MPFSNEEKASSLRNALPMFNVHELDSSKIKLGPIFFDKFISQISAKMTSLNLKNMINYLSAKSSEEL